MTDINTYANNLLIEFLDACHVEIGSALSTEFGDSWLNQGIERHLDSKSFERTRRMLTSPMAIIDMDKTDDELYGVEHLANIVIGNWSLFKGAFGNRQRTEVYFGEIAELRHNVSHRRQHHMLSKSELLRFTHNARLLLTAFDSPTARQFEAIATGLEQGGTPWGSQLSGTLPPAAEIVSEFVGRATEIRDLSTWLATDDTRQLVVWGYGGSGKSALAYQFARAVQDGAPRPLQAVVWLSAKVREYIEGTTRDRLADFDDVDSFGSAFVNSLYGVEPSGDEVTRQGIIKELNDTPVLLIIDDLDSILDNEDLTHFLLYEVRSSASKVVYTSRQRIPGLQTIEVLGFSDRELESFVRSRARDYELVVEDCLMRLPAIRSVTDAFPLFVDDLLRYAMFDGLKSAISDWSQRRGDAAREYSLRRQLSSLDEVAQRALTAVAVANRPVSSYELSTVSGFGDDDVQYAISELLKWRLLNRAVVNTAGRPTFSCNRNTQRLIQKTYGRDPTYQSYRESFQTLAGSVRPAALRRAVGIAINEARASVIRGDFNGAEESLCSAMTGELENNSDLWGALGWVLSRRRDDVSVKRARKAFRRSHKLGSRREDTYHHWKELEREVAENLINSAGDQDLLDQWRVAARVVQRGIERCGETPTLCGGLAYLRIREARTLERLNQFTSARMCFVQAAQWARRALEAPNTSSREVSRNQLYRSLVIALRGSDDREGIDEVMDEWRMLMGREHPDWGRDNDR